MPFDGAPRELDIELLDHQADFVVDMKTAILVLEGGLGCGKTIAILVKALALADASPGVAGLIVEPTTDLLGSILLATVDEFFEKWGVAFEFRTQWRGRRDVLLLWPGTDRETPIYLRSGDKPHRIVGFKVGWFLLDEADQMEAEVWRRCMGRMRDARAKVRQACACYTPEPGFNWTWTRFHEKRTPKMKVVEGISTKKNVFNPDGYVDDLTEAHDGAEVARVTEGKRSSREGLVFRRFDRLRNVRPCKTPFADDAEIEMWCDFNVAKMVWAFVSLRNGKAHVFDELVVEDTDTIDQAAEAAKRLALRMCVAGGANEERLRATDPERWPITPRRAAMRCTAITDAAGDAADSASKRSDTEIIRQEGFKVRHKASNPFIEDSVLAVNAALGDGWLLFDPDGARYVASCIEKIPYGPDGKPAKGSGSREKVKAGLDHAADLIRYGVFFHRPVHVRRGNQPRR